MNAIIVGAGINGVTAAIELKKRGHAVVLVDPGPLPHPLAASTDISKAVRAAYGADESYTELMDRCLPRWRDWNRKFGTELYHEVGALLLRQRPMEPGDFEFESMRLLERHGHHLERIDSARLRAQFPAFNAEHYPDGFFDREAGYAESGRVVSVLLEEAKALGVELREGARFAELEETNGRITGIALHDGQRISGDRVLVAAGAWTPFLLPQTRNFFRTTGQPVFHLRPRHSELFSADRFPFFGADISTTGYYGFPVTRDGVVKIANHGPGREMAPEAPERAVTTEEENQLREFLSWTIPALADAPIVYTRICLYCDTHDGDFWIAPDPMRPGLIVATGDSGHGFKFAPMLGELIADAVEEKSNRLLLKFRWRPEVTSEHAKEAARKLAKL